MNFIQQFKKHKPIYLFTFFKKSKSNRIGTLLIFLLFAGFIFYFQACKKKSTGGNDNNNTSDQALFEAFNSLKDTKLKFLEYADSTNGNPKQAIMLTKKWLDQQPGVTSSEVFDSTAIEVMTSSAIRYYYKFNEVNEEGSYVYRGGEISGAKLQASNTSTGRCSKVIKNKKVLIYTPVTYFSPYQDVLDYLNNSTANLDITYLKGGQCKPGLIETFNQYGLVILDTDGLSDGFISGDTLNFDPQNDPKDYKEFKDAAIKQLGQSDYDKLLTGDLLMNLFIDYKPFDPNWWKNPEDTLVDNIDIIVSSQYILKAPLLDSTIVFGNMCHSGEEKQSLNGLTPIATAFLSRNPATYYGYAFDDQYSYSVSNNFAHDMEDSLVRSLVIDKDSTGKAYLKSSNEKFFDPFLYMLDKHKLYLNQYKSPSWCYGGCGDPLHDVRDGKVYPTICIGNQVWMGSNLNYSGAGTCYEGYPSNCATYGKLYNISETTQLLTSSNNPSGIQGICPDGWHVPSKAEWMELIDFCGGLDKAPGKLIGTSGWNGNVNSTDEYNFSILPGGEFFGDGVTDTYSGIHTDAFFWATDGDGSNNFLELHVAAGSPMQWGWVAGPPKSWRYSVRCVKDQSNNY